jgi:hypothetical protein
MVTAFSLDSMHTIDGGTAKDFLERMMTSNTRVGGVMTPKGHKIVEQRFAEIRETWIYEPERKLRCLFIQ